MRYASESKSNYTPPGAMAVYRKDSLAGNGFVQWYEKVSSHPLPPTFPPSIFIGPTLLFKSIKLL